LLAAVSTAGSLPDVDLHQPTAQSNRGDLVYLNAQQAAALRRWARAPAGETAARPRQHPFPRGDDFVAVPLPRLAMGGPNADRAAADALAAYRRDAAVVDARLARKVTLAVKATALSDLCERLRGDTGIQLGAGQSVADEKVTLFCKEMPLRDVMRQLSRPFGYAWLRSGKAGEYQYELAQDLRSQLLEEELRNRERNEALIALEQEIERYRPYLGLSPDEALARAKGAAPGEKKLLQNLAGPGWGPLQIYFRLSRNDQSVLRSGQKLTFSAEPKPGEQPLPADVARGVLQSLRDVRLVRYDDGFRISRGDTNEQSGLLPSAAPEARAVVTLEVSQSELGQFTLAGNSGVFTRSPLPRNAGILTSDGPLATGTNTTALQPESEPARSRLAQDPSLRARVSIQPEPSCGVDLSPGPSPKRGGVPDAGYGMPRPGGPSSQRGDGVDEKLPLPASGRRDGGAASWPRSGQRRGPGPGRAFERAKVFRPLGGGGRSPGGGEVPPEKVTTADVLEAVHRATGLPIVADYYTRLYSPGDVAMQNRPLADALNRLADILRLRWNKEGDWLQFRSASFFNDRIKEVPNRLLTRWAALRRQRGALTLDDLTEIAGLPDAQLDAAEMAEGARLCHGVAEWDLARNRILRAHLRFLAGFTPTQRQEAMGATGLPFTRMSLAQQQRFITLALQYEDRPLETLEELSGATLRVDYTQPGGFEWQMPGPPWCRFVVPMETGRQGRRLVMAPVRDRTREGTLALAQRLDPQIREAILTAARRRRDAEVDAAQMDPQPGQIVPTKLDLRVIYIPGLSNRHSIHVVETGADYSNTTW
jgi:hypothetical protein